MGNGQWLSALVLVVALQRNVRAIFR
jgi:hypothetical protein